ncbi:MAG: hypothetical protein ACJAV2_002391 [Myxococcota bacterium]
MEVTSSLWTDVGRLTLGASVQGWAHTPDVTMPDRADDDAGVALPSDRSHGIAISPALSISPSKRSGCGASIQLPVWQWVRGSQLAPSYRMCAQCQMSWGKSSESVVAKSP